MHIFVFFTHDPVIFNHLIVDLAKRHGIETCDCFVWGQRQFKFLSDVNEVKYENITMYSENIRSKMSDGFDSVYLEFCEVEYEISINRIIYAERLFFEGKSYEQILSLVELTFRQAVSDLTAKKFDFAFSINVQDYVSYIYYVVARKLGIPFYLINTGRIPNRMVVNTDPLDYWEEVVKLSQRLSETGLGQADQELLENYKNKFHSEKPKPLGVRLRSNKRLLSYSDVTRLIRYIAYKQGDKIDETLPTIRGLVGRKLSKIYNHICLKVSMLTSLPKTGDRYVYFPLHYQPEASTLVRGVYYLDQVALIENITKSLPIGYKLYVKIHPSSKGKHHLSFYKKIASIFSVKLVPSDYNSWDLIENSSAVAVVTGTTGWEALQLGKPVITFGECFYNSLSFVYKAGTEPLDNWYNVFNRALNSHQINYTELDVFTMAILKLSSKSFLFGHRVMPRVLAPENIHSINDLLIANHKLFQNRANAVRSG